MRGGSLPPAVRAAGPAPSSYRSAPASGAHTPAAGSQGAATGLWAATSSLLSGRGGLYLEDCEVARVTDEDGPMDNGWVRRYAIDPTSARRLWELSVAATGAGPITR